MKGRNKHGGNGGHRTSPYSLQRIALLFPAKSLQRVYFHGMWQQSRKRQPSLQLENMRNPRSAFNAAVEIEGEYLQAIRQLPYFRAEWRWSFPDYIVAAILNHESLDTIADIY